MVEYLHQAIRASKGEKITISAIIKDDDGVSVSTGALLEISDNENVIEVINGVYDSASEVWSFIIPEEAIIELEAKRYFYSIKQDNNSLNFKQPLYLV